MTSAYSGVGKISVALYSDSATFEGRKFRPVENSSAFEFSFTQEEKTLPDYTNASGGIDAHLLRQWRRGPSLSNRAAACAR